MLRTRQLPLELTLEMADNQEGRALLVKLLNKLAQNPSSSCCAQKLKICKSYSVRCLWGARQCLSGEPGLCMAWHGLACGATDTHPCSRHACSTAAAHAPVLMYSFLYLLQARDDKGAGCGVAWAAGVGRAFPSLRGLSVQARVLDNRFFTGLSACPALGRLELVRLVSIPVLDGAAALQCCVRTQLSGGQLWCACHDVHHATAPIVHVASALHRPCRSLHVCNGRPTGPYQPTLNDLVPIARRVPPLMHPVPPPVVLLLHDLYRSGTTWPWRGCTGRARGRYCRCYCRQSRSSWCGAVTHHTSSQRSPRSCVA